MPVHNLSDKVVLQHPEGSSVVILLFGATIISWKSPSLSNPELKERLFVSSKAFLDGSKPVRGGIPVVFPCFGAPQHPEHLKLPQHGFARNETWKFDSIVMDNEVGVSVRLVLEPTPQISAVYTRSFRLSYVVTLALHQISTDIHVTNTGSTGILEFQALLHTYLSAPAKEVIIKSLKSVTYYDKTEPTEDSRQSPKTEQRSAVDVRRYTDSVYENAPQRYEIEWSNGEIQLKTQNFKDLVIWNPGEAGKQISDMEDGGWDRYVCVEPGFVRGFVKLAPGQQWLGAQVLTVEK